MQMIKKYPLLILFTVFMVIVSIGDMIVSKREFSEMENRYLTQRPKMTLSSLLAKDENQKYSYKYEEYINDQFIGRDGWITMKSVSESAVGKIENNGIVYGKDNYLFEKYLFTDERRIEMNLGFINRFIEQYSAQVPITFAVIPNSYQILSDYLPKGLHNVNQQQEIEQIYDKVADPAQTFDLFPTLMQAAKEGTQQVYYRTDHHWTSFGAYDAYRALMESRGREAVKLDALQPYQKLQPDFYGTYYSKCKLYSAVPDTITWFDIPFQSITIGGEPKTSLNENAKWSERDKHAAFLWGNNDLTIIKTKNNLNRQEGETSRVMLIKDSYGNSFAPFLTYSYDEVWVVDLRSLTSKMSDVLATTTFDDVIILYNFMNLASDTNIAKLTY